MSIVIVERERERERKKDRWFGFVIDMCMRDL